MTDIAGLSAWQPKFKEWIDFAVPLFQQGKPQDAFGKYPWFTTEGEPFARLGKPASEARFALVTTGGYTVEGEHEPFTGAPDFSDAAPSIHWIHTGADRSKLSIHHHGYDHRFAEEDINVNLPFDRLQELVDSGEIGSLSPDTAVLMGLIPNVGPLLDQTIPEIVARFGADAVLLVPS